MKREKNGDGKIHCNGVFVTTIVLLSVGRYISKKFFVFYIKDFFQSDQIANIDIPSAKLNQ